MRHQLFSLGAGLALLLTAGMATAHAQECQQDGDNQGNNTGCASPHLPSTTPELDSLVLFGAGAAGIASYAVMRVRAARRHDEDPETSSTDRHR